MDQSHDEPALAVRVTLPPLQKVVEPEGVIVAVGVETLTVALLLTVGHDVTKTSTLSVIGLVVLASKLTTLPVLEPTMVPLVIDQRYVPPGTTGVDAVCPVELAQTVTGAVIAGVAGQPTTPTATELVLFAPLESGVVVLTVAVLVTVVPVEGAVMSMVMIDEAAAAKGGLSSVQVMAGLPVQVQPVSVMLVSVVPAGSVSVTVTSFAGPAPMLLMVSV